jgi:hypothetical protein
MATHTLRLRLPVVLDTVSQHAVRAMIDIIEHKVGGHEHKQYPEHIGYEQMSDLERNRGKE